MNVRVTTSGLERRAFSIKQVSEITGFCVATLYKHIGAGSLVARKCGRRTLILSKDLDCFLDGLPILSLNDNASG